MRKIVGTLLAALLIILIGAPVPAAAAPRSAPRRARPVSAIRTSRRMGMADTTSSTTSSIRYNPGTDRLRRRDDHGARHPVSVAVQPRPQRPEVSCRPGQRCARRNGVASGDELIIRPQKGPGQRRSMLPGPDSLFRFPTLLPEPALGQAGVFRTDDGALDRRAAACGRSLVPGQRPSARQGPYTFAVTVPEGLEVVANGFLDDVNRHRRRTTWVWDAPDPMASYLATATIGAVRPGLPRRRHQVWDALDPSLFDPARTADRRAVRRSRAATLAYKRLSRDITVPAGGGATLLPGDPRHRAQLGLLLRRGPHRRHRRLDDAARCQRPHRPGQRARCPFWLSLHPFLDPLPDRRRRGSARRAGPRVTGGRPPVRATATRSGRSTCPHTPARRSRSSISYASDDIFQSAGVFVDDVVVSTGEGTTSFEDDGDPLDGWTVAGPAAGSPGNANDWIAGRRADAPSDRRDRRAALDRQPEFIAFLVRHVRAVSVLGRPGVSSTTSAGSGSPWRTRPGRSTPRLLRRLRVGDAVSCTNSPTSGSGTASP